MSVNIHTSIPTQFPFLSELRAFDAFGKPTECAELSVEVESRGTITVPVFINEFWTAKQRDAHSLHEVSYRACFKPQLPRFFIERLSAPGDAVYDPFMGRGTTLLEAALLGRNPIGCDINPLSRILVTPRIEPPALEDVAQRLRELSLDHSGEIREDLLVFYHPQTLREITALRNYLIEREAAGTLDAADRWIRMVVVNRLTGHSSGFLSVYTLPPNQAVSIKSQIKINARLNQQPEPRDVRAIIMKKSHQLLKGLSDRDRQSLASAARAANLITATADATPDLADHSVKLIVTSPPFLDVVDYATDNWLRCWFCGIDEKSVRLTAPKKLDAWEVAITKVFTELRRVLRADGFIAFEVGEVKKGTIRLEEAVIRCGSRAGLNPIAVMINAQNFTKTANCWGIDNLSKGTNTNRIVVFQR